MEHQEPGLADARLPARPGTRAPLAALVLGILGACTSGGGGSDPPPPPPPAPGVLQVDGATSSVTEGSGPLTVTVLRTGGSDGVVSVTLATADGTAVQGQDYGPVTTTVSFADGDAAAKTVDVPILDDAAPETSETFTIALSAPTGGATLGAPASATITVDDDDPLPPAPGELLLGSAISSVAEGDGLLTVTVLRTGGSDGAVSVTFATADGTAVQGQDYGPVTTTVSFADGDAAAKTVDVPILDDAIEEASEDFTVALSAPTGGATLGAPASATITVGDDDAPPPAPGNALNDTGVTPCSTAVADGLPCSSVAAGTDQFPRQDAEAGRDVTAADGTDGRAGFSFLKLDATGTALADQAADYATTPWGCVLDQVTGLTWEVRTSDGGLRDASWRYAWHDALGWDDGGRGGAPGPLACGGAACDTQGYADAVNAAGLCGRQDWRLPTRAELLGLADLGATSAPLVDAAYFPDGLAGPVWAGSADSTLGVWAVDFGSGDTRLMGRSATLPVRLVSGGPRE